MWCWWDRKCRPTLNCNSSRSNVKMMIRMRELQANSDQQYYCCSSESHLQQHQNQPEGLTLGCQWRVVPTWDTPISNAASSKPSAMGRHVRFRIRRTLSSPSPCFVNHRYCCLFLSCPATPCTISNQQPAATGLLDRKLMKWYLLLLYTSTNRNILRPVSIISSAITKQVRTAVFIYIISINPPPSSIIYLPPL